jgi:large subunit ribosomal protein L5e
LKGAVDGGIYVPHSVKRFPGYNRSDEEGVKDTYEPTVHRERIFGVHVDKYMADLKAESAEAY